MAECDATIILLLWKCWLQLHEFPLSLISFFLILFIIIIMFETESCFVTQAGIAVVQSWLTASFRLPISNYSHVSASQVAETTGAHHHTWLIFVILVEMGLHRVFQAGLKLLALTDLPALASQSAGITGLRHHARPGKQYIFKCLGNSKYQKNKNELF